MSDTHYAATWLLDERSPKVCPRPVKCLSLPDAPVITGTSPEVFAHYGLTGEGIAKTVAEFLPAE